MEILIVSKSIKCLDVNKATTSSELFELELSMELSALAKVTILSFQVTEKQSIGNLSLYPLGRVRATKRTIEEIIVNNRLLNDGQSIIMFFGYDYLTLNILKAISRKFKAKLFSYVFDTHKAAIEHKRLLRRIAVDFYFRLGMRKLNKIDGVLLFREEAYKELRLRIPYLLTRVGISSSNHKCVEYKRNDHGTFRIVYAGTLIKYNGIKEMLGSMRYLDKRNITLTICGDGPLRDYVIECSKNDPRILYMGLLPKEKVDEIILSADLLLNLRDTRHFVNKFAFPSKLIQYLYSGIPVLSTRVIEDPRFDDIAFVVDDIHPESIAKIILYIFNNPQEQEKRSKLARQYVRENYLWRSIVNEIYDFFNEISKR
ncbi:hypothetical protein IM42_05080 [Fervidobacterium sp. SC_NGM5_O18]|uniref:Glycosyl transferase family 1 domain-containing protein n=1 Tax=Fervidobacterium pennivorans TaxID=93466 RepID=A0A172T1H7_FERPE|nr:glycosyltransferase [Fervidobacterium pennivorans]ANE40855.1 hypothetical protein JM64_01665 [Fervidobacterium pennivorans]PHJ12171.1 hypothetical protein IM42_05080 [Fervidobacterium sp. SC_NGM5_O18]